MKTADFNSCLEVVKSLASAHRMVRDATDDATRRFEFRELLNLMEALAMLINRGKVGPSTREYAEHFLEEAWAWLKADASVVDLVESSITGDGTFRELLTFAEMRAERIEGLTKAYKVQIASGADGELQH
jgi:hypothetical protein